MAILRSFVSVCFWVTAVLVAIIAMFVGWLSQTWLPEGHLFATLIPLLVGGKPPPPIFGAWSVPLTPPVPDDATPKRRPYNEILIKTPRGDKIPANGLGMCCRPSAYDDESVRRTVLHFLLSGGRHIDTAQLYLNHKPIGLAIEEAVRRGVPRKEIWITTKLAERFYDRGEAAILGMLRSWLAELRIKQLEMVLLHVAEPLLPLPSFAHTCQDWAMCRRSAWQTLAKAVDQGLVRNIGVSNFNIEQIKSLRELNVAPIAANQIMINPFAPQWVFDIADYCQEHGIVVTAWAPLSGTTMQTMNAINDVVVQSIAHNYSGRALPSGQKAPSTAQIILRWALQKGYTIIPGSGNPTHQVENLEIYNFELSNDDMKRMESLKDSPGFMYGGPAYMKPGH